MPDSSQLPPLILHPFSGGGGIGDPVRGNQRQSCADRVDPSRTKMTPSSSAACWPGRYQEVRMLIFLGKDLFRWLGQCVEFVASGEGADVRIIEQSFRSAPWSTHPPGTRAQKVDRLGRQRRALRFLACHRASHPVSGSTARHLALADFPEGLSPLRRPRLHLFS